MVEQVSSVIFTYYKTAEYFVPYIEKNILLSLFISFNIIPSVIYIF